MNISLHQSCLNLFKNAESRPHSDTLFIKELSEQARLAWASRKEGDTTVRFIFAMPSKYGQSFHFFTVLPYRKGGNVLSVRA
ncbi:hypothetical protein [Rodentibacter haemolyticus]|uniref:Uncharacterized protein n=1 Tax=Rodentibacter haemolyticus TaxID=2778911 RepID=A0ABX6UXM0_9PAST|nr:hypothetical protein [Rodentibacter haemolyticus]QPB42833.1 hypothetical protein IHV77_01525 [Rodentibacter haemolyticus]